MATALAGNGGNVKIGSTAVGGIKDWSLTINQATNETTSFGDTWKKYIGTIKDCTGTFTGFWDMTDAEQVALQNGLLNGTTVSAVFDVDGTHNYSGTFNVTKIDPKSNVDGLVEISFDVQLTGALTYA